MCGVLLTRSLAVVMKTQGPTVGDPEPARKGSWRMPNAWRSSLPGGPVCLEAQKRQCHCHCRMPGGPVCLEAQKRQELHKRPCHCHFWFSKHGVRIHQKATARPHGPLPSRACHTPRCRQGAAPGPRSSCPAGLREEVLGACRALAAVARAARGGRRRHRRGARLRGCRAQPARRRRSCSTGTSSTGTSSTGKSGTRNAKSSNHERSQSFPGIQAFFAGLNLGSC